MVKAKTNNNNNEWEYQNAEAHNAEERMNCCLVQLTDETIRHESASGGMITGFLALF